MRAEQARAQRRWPVSLCGERDAEPAGIILADTKFELGIVDDGSLILIDEVADARFVALLGRLHATSPGAARIRSTSSTCATGWRRSDWDKTPPGPELPADVIAGTRSRYVEAFERITGGSFERLPGRGPAGRRRGAPVSTLRLSVSIMPRDGILDPAGQAVEASLPQLHADNVHACASADAVELSVEVPSRRARRSRRLDRLAGDFLANPLIEGWTIRGRRVAIG